MKRIFVLLTVALSLGLSACTNNTVASMTLVAHDSFVMSDELIAEYEKTVGPELTIVRAGDVGEMTGKLVLTKDAPIADAVYGIDNTFASVIDENKVLGENKLVPINFADICFNVDIQYFKEKNLAIPDHWKELIQPKYKNLTVIENPNLSLIKFDTLTNSCLLLHSPLILNIASHQNNFSPMRIFHINEPLSIFMYFSLEDNNYIIRYISYSSIGFNIELKLKNYSSDNIITS